MHQEVNYEHSADCAVVAHRVALDRDIAADPTNRVLLGARVEYYGGGDQEVEECSCGAVPNPVRTHLNGEATECVECGDPLEGSALHGICAACIADGTAVGDTRSRAQVALDIVALRSVERAKREVLQDIERGIVPATVGSFSELHDYVDANEYGGLCEDWACDVRVDLFIGFGNAVQSAVDAWIRNGRR